MDNGSVWIGGDSAGVARMSLRVRADEKVFRNGPMLMGFTDSFRMGQLLRYSLKVPLQEPNSNTDHYMATIFVDAVRECLKAGGYAEKENEAERGGTFLIGYRGQLFEIEGDYQVAKPSENYSAVGCGAQVALGALYVSKSMEPRNRVKLALRAAERFSAGVRGPYTIMELKQ